MTRAKRTVWTDDETVCVLAYLDYYTKKRKESGRWSDEEILRRIASHVKSYSSNQIRGKLFELWGGSHTALARNRSQNVFKFGSRCLKMLPDRLKPDIRKLIKVIEIDEESEEIHTPQTLRNGKERSVSIDRRWLRFKRSTSSVSSNELQKEAVQQRDAATVEPKKEAKEDLVHSMTEMAESADLVPDVESRRNTLVEVANSVDSSPLTEIKSSRESTPAEDIRLTRRRLFDLRDARNIPLVDYDGDAALSLPTPSSETGHVYELLSSLLTDNRYFREKCAELTKENERLMFQSRQLFNLQRRIEKDPSFSQASVILKYEQDIADLKRSESLQNVVLPFLRSSGSEQVPSNFNQVTRAFDELTTALYCLAGTEYFQCDLGAFHQPPSPTLKALLQRALPQESFSRFADLNPFAHNGGSPKVAASLTAAAVCEWVFLSDTRCAILLSTPIHESYQQFLRAGCGERMERNLDVLAHQSIIRDENFRRVYVEQTAEKCLTRLLEVFCEISNDNITFKHDTEARKQIESAFLHALTLKYELLLREEKFRINWLDPGVVFDDGVMDIHDSEKSQVSQMRNEDGALTASLTLVPGLQGHPHHKERLDDVVFFESESYDKTTQLWTLRGMVSII